MAKHSGAGTATAQVDLTGDRLTLTVGDDGRGGAQIPLR